MPTAVIYARFSCAKQREASIEDQLRVCREWCKREGYEVLREYCDYAVSGRTDERPQFQEMIHNAGESDIVLVYMLDRFSRDTYDAVVYKRKLRDKGVRVISATEAMPDGPEAILIESVYEALAAMESIHTSKRVKRGMEGNAQKCMHNGVTLYGYDFVDGKYAINEEEAAIVRECFARKGAGESAYSIAQDLSRRGIKASYGFVYNMLKKEKYTGTYIWGDIRIEGGMPAIISKEEFFMAQGKPRKNRANEQWGDFPLSGKAICESCGFDLQGTSGHGKKGTKYQYYKCKCGAKPIRADKLEASIVEALRVLLSDRAQARHVAEIVIELTGDDTKYKEAEKRQREVQKGIENMLDAVSRGFDAELAMAKIDELKAQEAANALELRIHSKKYQLDDLTDFLQRGANMDDTTILKAFVYQVMVGEKDVVVTLNYDKDGNEPARINLSRVRIDSKWWTSLQPGRTPIEVGYAYGLIMLRFPRVA